MFVAIHFKDGPYFSGIKTQRVQQNKTRTSKVGAISKAQKAQNILEKKLKFLKFFFFQKSSIVPKNVKGDPSGSINIHSVAKYQKTRRGPFGDIKKNPKKSRTESKKIQRGPLGTSGFVGFLEKVNNERGDPFE